MNSIPAQLAIYQNPAEMHPAQTLTLKDHNPSALGSGDFQKTKNALSSRSLKFDLIDSRSRQKEGEDSYYQNLQNELKGTVLPLAGQSTHRLRLDQNSPNKSVGLIGDNMSAIKRKYQFGEEGVKVIQGVVQKYKASNYNIQRDMLEKFKREAEQFRRNRNDKGKADISNNAFLQAPQPHYRRAGANTALENISFVQMRSEENERKAQFERELQRRNKVIQQLREEQQLARRQQQLQRQKQHRKKVKREQYVQREKENLIQVGNMLREIDKKIKESSLELHSNLKELRNELSPKNQYKVIKIVNRKFSGPIMQSDFQNTADQLLQLHNSSCKLPVVMYNNRYYDARAYYGDADLPQRIQRGTYKNTAAQLQTVVAILRRNQHRLKVLNEEFGY